jgi:hypothetical protein
MPSFEFPKIRLDLIGRNPAGQFKSMADHIVEQMRVTVTKETELLANQVKTNIATKFRNPQKMQPAVGYKVRQAGPGWIGEVDASGEFTGYRPKFMAIQEFGGTVKLPAIFPRQRRALWFTGARHPFASARPHTVQIPPRSYLRLALEQRQAAIAAAFKQATARATEEA